MFCIETLISAFYLNRVQGFERIRFILAIIFIHFIVIHYFILFCCILMQFDCKALSCHMCYRNKIGIIYYMHAVNALKKISNNSIWKSNLKIKHFLALWIITFYIAVSNSVYLLSLTSGGHQELMFLCT